MIAFLATTAFFQAVSADSNQTWIDHFAATKDDAAALEGLKALGEGFTCEKLVKAGVGYNIKYNQFCPVVSDYTLQCAGKDMEPLGQKEDKAAENEDVPAERRLTDKATLQANKEKFGELLSCIERNRYYSVARTSWLHADYSKMTCEEMVAGYGKGDCKSGDAQMYAINICCPATCKTKAELECPETPEASTDAPHTSTEAGTDDAATGTTTSGASTMGLISALLVLAQ